MTDPICKRCAKPRSKHALANFPDGPMIGGPTLVCPTAALFLEQVEHAHEAFGYSYGAKVMYCRCGATRTETIDADVWSGWNKP